MEMGIFANIHRVHSLQYHQHKGSDEVQDQDYEVQPVSVYYPPAEDTTGSHGKHLVYGID